MTIPIKEDLVTAARSTERTSDNNGSYLSNTAPAPTRVAATAETKPAFKTTEMLFYLLTVIGVLIATQVVDGFKANQGWFYVSLLTLGYMLSRGLAKAGSYAKDNDPRTDAGAGGR